MLYRSFLITIAFFFTGEICSQTFLRNNIDLGIGFNQVKEENLHPKVHSGVILQPSFHHRFKSHHISELAWAMGYSKVKTRFEDLKASVNLQLNSSYRYLIKHTERENFSLATGPGLNMRYHVSYYPRWDDSHLYWANQVNLSLENQLVYRINKARLVKGHLGLSLLSLISRPMADRQYKIDDLSFRGIVENFHSFSEFGSVDKAMELSYGIEFYNQPFPTRAYGIFYAFEHRRIQGVTSNLFQSNIQQIGFKQYFK